MSKRPANRQRVLGCPVDRISAAELRTRLPALATGDALTHLVTLNPEQVMLARADAGIREIIERAEIVTADGVGITAALRLRGETLPDRITGVEIVEWIAELCLPVYFLGGSNGVGEQAAARLRERFPCTNVAGHWAGGTPDPGDDDESIGRLAASGASVICVAYGAPGQLQWIERNRERLVDAGVRLAIGVGGSLDYHAGAVKRPPPIVRRLGLEWLARLIREPWRWRRQTVLPVFTFLAFGEAIRSRLTRR
jgi:N-acetylglucosaminyldiphosphoundecaprenol N-acetyl-beta-D-mannosaminyltransferase